MLYNSQWSFFLLLTLGAQSIQDATEKICIPEEKKLTLWNDLQDQIPYSKMAIKNREQN